MTKPRTFESFRQQAEDLLNGNYWDSDTPHIYKKDIIARVFVDIYWDGWNERTKETFGDMDSGRN
jgi:hypothetical protein